MARPKGVEQRILRGTKITNTRKNLFYKNILIPNYINGCMNWTAAKRNGYGRFCVNGKNVSAHRYSYELYVGKIPKDFCVLHVCDNPSCVRPDHLFLGDYDLNNKDRIKKGRHKTLRGELNGMTILTTKQVIKIKELLKNNIESKLISKIFNVSHHVIHKIKVNKNWRHIPWD